VSSILTTASHNKIGHEERKARAHAVFSAMMSKNAMSPITIVNIVSSVSHRRILDAKLLRIK
jgi:hypothetical protein